MPKLLILSHNADEYIKLLQNEELPNLEIVTDPSQCDIVLGEPKRIRDELPHLPHLKWAQSIYAGVEPLVDPTQHRDYILTNARGVFGELMSEYVFGYMLAHEKGIFKRYQAQQAVKWDRFESGVLRGKTIGLLGVGSIGAHMAGTAKHFGMKVKGFTQSSEDCSDVDEYYHPSPLPSPKGRGGIIAFAEGLAYLVVVLPKTEGTNKIVNAELLNALPRHAILINVGRGNAVDESALVEALEGNKIAGAVLDVTEQEPLPEDHPFWTTPNLLLTFHTSAMSFPEDMVKLFAENYRLYIEGKPLKYRVNFERGY
jgi:phosphoglycerate dehydrogenase-like enzyme